MTHILNESSSFKENYNRYVSTSGEVVYDFYGIVKEENINSSILSMSSGVSYRFCESGFITTIKFNSPSRESLIKKPLSLLCHNLNDYCMKEDQTFEFKLVG